MFKISHEGRVHVLTMHCNSMLAHPVHSILIGNCQNQPFYCGQFVVYALLPTDDKTVNYQLSVLWFCLEFAAFPSHPLGEFASCTAGDKKFS